MSDAGSRGEGEGSGQRAVGAVHDPLEFISAEHDRQGVICASLERLAGNLAAEDAPESAAFVLRYLEEDLSLHVADEEEDLFPVMTRRARADDGFAALLTIMQEEHLLDRAYCDRLLEPLRALSQGTLPPNPGAFAEAARAFAVFQHRHLAWENGVILELARKRLDSADLKEMARRIAKRHGLPGPD